MKKQYKPSIFNIIYQLNLPVEIFDPVYTFCEDMNCIDLRKYPAFKESKTSRKRYIPEILLKIILFSFVEKGYTSVREIEKLCKNQHSFYVAFARK